MKIGIVGSGDVAQALAAGFLGRGDEVMLGTRDTAKLEDWKAQAGPHARVGSFAEAAAFGELIVVATHGVVTEEVVRGIGADAFAGKIVIDTTNPLEFDDAGPHLAIGFSDSLGERIQRAIPQAHVVKAFNTVGSQHMVKPGFPGGPPTMFIAGNDSGAKTAVTNLLKEWGWETADLGGIECARYLEPMCMTWVIYGIKSGSWNHAFKLLKK